MPKYTVTNDSYLILDGKVFSAGEIIELTEEQAGRLGSKVEPTSETELSGKTVVELKEEAKAANIDGYSKMNKEELIAALAEVGQEGEVAPVEDDEQE